MRNHAGTATRRLRRVLFSCLSALALAALPAIASAASAATDAPAKPAPQAAPSMLRVIAPVRLSAEPGDKLVAQAAAARELLEKFQNAGFESALWVVDALPAKNDNIKPWAEACLRAFPGKVIVALDTRLQGNAVSLPADRLQLFLATLLSPSAPRDVKNPALANISILVNYAGLNNCACMADVAPAVAATVQNAKMVRKVSPGTFLWLFVEDCSKASAGVPEWIKAAGGLADGFYLSRPHEWSLSRDAGANKAAEPVLKLGKQVVRAGFRYSAPTLRPGLEEDLKQSYRQNVSLYEKALKDAGYAGYGREIGDAIPAGVNGNLNLLVDVEN